MADKEKLRAETAAMLRAVLISSPRGVPFEKLYRDYRQLTGKTIPYKELGFTKLENFIQDIPDVARAERGPDGTWTLKGVASDADKHVAKLISKQKKPKVRKSAKSFARKPASYRNPPVKFHSPVKAPPKPNRPPVRLPHRFQWASNGRSRPNAPSFPRMSINVSSSNRTVRTVSTPGGTPPAKPPPKSAPQPTSASASSLNDLSLVKWLKSEIDKAPNGMWASRLPFLYNEKFKKTLNKSDMVSQLRSRPDIARIEEPIEGRVLLYKPITRTIAREVPREAKNEKQTVRETPKLTPLPQKSLSQNIVKDVVLECELPENGTSVVVYISYIVNGGKFFVNKRDATCISDELNAAIYKHYEKSKYNSDDIPLIKPGQIFCAQFIEDDSFYRARVLDVVDSKHVRVQYVDFGNEEVIPIERLRVLVEKFHSQPVQALQCCLDGVQPLNEEQTWSDASFKEFCKHSFDKALTMAVKDSEGNILSVSLYDEASNTDIGEELVKAGLVTSSSKSLSSTPSSSSSSLSSSTGTQTEKSTPPKLEASVSRTRSRRIKNKMPGIVEIPDEPFIDVLVCNITGTYNIYLRLVGDEYSSKLERVQESMNSYYNGFTDKITNDPVAGEVYALLSEDVWCRVKVTSVNGSAINVFFVDHGDMAETTKSEIRVLAPLFKTLPFQVFECVLSGLPKTKNPTVVTPLRDLAMGEVCVAEIVKRNSSLVFIDLIVIDPKSGAEVSANNVIRQLVIPDEELKPVLPKVGDTIDVRVPYISPTGSVFLHITEAGTKRLQELTEDLTEHYMSKRSKANEFVSNPTEGKVCCARSDDGNWYRVKIISASNRNAVEVLYVDYGNQDTVVSTNLREPTQVNDHVLSLPFQALECQLYDVPKDDWNEELSNRMMEIIHQGSVTAEILSEGNPPAVSLLLTIGEKGEEITERLVGIMGIADMEDEVEPGQYVDDDTHRNGDVEYAEENDKKGDDVSDKDTDDVSDKNTNDVAGKNGDGQNEIATDGGNDEKVADVSDKKSAQYGNLDKNNDGDAEQNAVIQREKNAGDKTPEQVPQIVQNEERTVITMNDVVNDAQTTGDNPSAQPEVGAIDAGKKHPVKALHLDSGWLDILVTNAKDPEHFTFQILPNLDEFYAMNDKLNKHYQGSQSLDDVPVEGGLYAVYHNDHDYWYRAMVETIIKDEKAYVLFVDYGDTATVDVENIIRLDDAFLDLPFQCVQASLGGIEPKIPSKSTKSKWPKASQKEFQELTLNKTLVAKATPEITEYYLSSSPRVVVELYDTSNPTNDVLISVIMIKKDHAQPKSS